MTNRKSFVSLRGMNGCRQTIYLKTQWTVECFRFMGWVYVAICAQNCKAEKSKDTQSQILTIPSTNLIIHYTSAVKLLNNFDTGTKEV